MGPLDLMDRNLWEFSSYEAFIWDSGLHNETERYQNPPNYLPHYIKAPLVASHTTPVHYHHEWCLHRMMRFNSDGPGFLANNACPNNCLLFTYIQSWAIGNFTSFQKDEACDWCGNSRWEFQVSRSHTVLLWTSVYSTMSRTETHNLIWRSLLEQSDRLFEAGVDCRWLWSFSVQQLSYGFLGDDQVKERSQDCGQWEETLDGRQSQWQRLIFKRGRSAVRPASNYFWSMRYACLKTLYSEWLVGHQFDSAEKANRQCWRNVGLRGSRLTRLTQTTAEIDPVRRYPRSPGCGNPGLGVGHVSFIEWIRRIVWPTHGLGGALRRTKTLPSWFKRIKFVVRRTHSIHHFPCQHCVNVNTAAGAINISSKVSTQSFMLLTGMYR